jgi:hypothetical protein
MPVANAGHGESKGDKFAVVKRAENLAANLPGNHEHAQWDELNVGESPDFFL